MKNVLGSTPLATFRLSDQFRCSPTGSNARSSVYWFAILIAAFMLVAQLDISKASAQALTWTNPAEDTSDQIYGDQIGGPAALLYGTEVVIAYNDYNHPGNINLRVTGDGNFPVTGSTVVSVPGHTVYATTKPALGVNNGNLYVGWIDNNGAPSFAVSLDGGATFGYSVYQCASSGAVFAPTFVTYGSYLYMMYAQGSGHLFTVCKIDPSTNTVVSVIEPGGSIGAGPSAVVYLSQIFVAFKANDTSNAVYYYTSSDGANYAFQTASGQSHTSTAPTIITDPYGQWLYIGFRQNDPTSHDFFYIYSTDGQTWTQPIDVGHSTGGPPCLALTPQGNFVEYYRQNATDSYLQAIYANYPYAN